MDAAYGGRTLGSRGGATAKRFAGTVDHLVAPAVVSGLVDLVIGADVGDRAIVAHPADDYLELVLWGGFRRLCIGQRDRGGLFADETAAAEGGGGDNHAGG
ncbi:MAG: hypothetical protein H0X55_07365, partial [Thermoleophilaceae bacterium]|nr:hypothetical protein [Thermoleophilaceae bacterium]